MDKYINLAIHELGEKYFKNLNISFVQLKDQSELNVKKVGNDVTINYGQRSLLFYGLTLLKQNHLKNHFDIMVHKHFLTNGLMHDCSRNGALNDEQIKRMLLTSALFGLNRFYLYLEDLYEISEEPLFGYLRGRYSQKEIKPILEFAAGLGITIIPCIQTLSHLNQMLKWRQYKDIMDSEFTITTGEEKTYQLIEKMLKTAKDIFNTNIIHIGLDETWDIGLFRYKNKNIAINKSQEYLDHLNRVYAICKKLDIKPLMWADMFFQLDMGQSVGDWYQHQGPFKEEIKNLIPDLSLIYWDYYHNDLSLYQRLLKTLKDTGKETYYASGAISWIGFAPNITQSLEITKVGLKAAILENIENIFVTSWGDNGNECSVITSYPALALHALYDYYGQCDDQKLSSLLKAVTGDDLERWKALQLPNDLNDKMSAYSNPSKPFLYQDILTGIFDKRVKEDDAKKYVERKIILSNISKKSKKYAYVYANLAALCDLLSYKVDIGVRLRKAYQAKNKEALQKCLTDIKIIKNKLEFFTRTMRKQWNRENKPFGFDIIDGRLGFLRNRIDTAYFTLDQYLKGKTNIIEELEEDILLWNDYHLQEEININSFMDIASVNVF